ncbi:MAG: nuclear transport factor 2 family protein [Spongiibacter sp.]|nr:nuclear transport factor 2 family protein [Spongiibacter sp.]
MPESIERSVAAEAIRTTLARYCRYVDRGNSDALAQLFHANSEYRPMAGRDRYRGPAGAKQFFVDLKAEFIAAMKAGGPVPPRLKHHLSLPDIEFISDAEASVETRFAVYSAIGLDHTGYYLDRLSPAEAGGWHFTYREICLDWVNPESALNALLA